MILQELRDEFTIRYPSLVRMAMSHFPAEFHRREEREEKSQRALSIAWRDVHRHYVAGRVDHDNAWRWIKDCLFYAIRHVNAGRDLPRSETGHRGEGRPDVYARMRKVHGDMETDLREFHSPGTPVPDQAAWNLDMPAFFGTLTPRQRTIAYAMMEGYSTTELAHIFGVSPGRISQFRSEFKRLFDEYFDE